MFRKLSLTLLAGPLLLAACGGDEVALPIETLIEYEATWQCDVTRYSFADSQAIESKQAEVMASFGITSADHATFTEVLAEDEELRGTVADRVDARCPVATDEVVDQ